MTTKASPTSAPGQLLGYSLQFPRALCRLLQVGPSGAVGIEVLGDVDAYAGDGIITNEEDKSSLIGNPLNDRSTDLWKTFNNWVKGVVDQRFDPSKTRFVLYCNKEGRPALVNKFSEADTPGSVKEALMAAEAELGSTDHEHDIWTYFDYVMNKNRQALETVVQSFTLVIGSDTSHRELEAELERMLITGSSKTFLMDEMGGWFQRVVMERISNGEPAIVTFQELRARFAARFDQLRARELVDFAASRVSTQDVKSRLSSRPVFVRQLDFINVDDDVKFEAVMNYLRAECNRAMWIENEFLDMTTAEDLEKKLQTYWSNRRHSVKIAYNHLADEDRGQLLYSDCMTRQEMIRDVSPPAGTIAGTYHALSDKRELGWHPKWEAEFIQKEGANE